MHSLLSLLRPGRHQNDSKQHQHPVTVQPAAADKSTARQPHVARQHPVATSSKQHLHFGFVRLQTTLYTQQHRLKMFSHLLQSTLHGGISVGSDRHEFSNAPLWLMGRCYKMLAQAIAAYEKQQSEGDSASTAATTSHDQPSHRNDNTSQHQPYLQFLQQVYDIPWFTYRRNMEDDLLSTGVTSDSGWGCMLRSGQMMLAATLKRHLAQRPDTQSHTTSHFHTPSYASTHSSDTDSAISSQILSWFLDTYNPTLAPFSIHNMLATSMSSSTSSATDHLTQSQQRVGQWQGPLSTYRMISQCLHHITIPNFALVIADDSTIYRDKVTEACTITEPRQWSEHDNNARYHHFDGPDEVVSGWRSCLLVVPVRLGASQLNTDYLPSLLSCFQYSQSVGFVGGKPRSSLYFIGVQDQSVLYLDPHTVQPATLSYEDLRDPSIQQSYHCPTINSIAANQLDPSLAIGFYCRDKADFEHFWQAAKFRNDCTSHPVFALADKSIKYTYTGDYSDDDEVTASADTAKHSRRTSSDKDVETKSAEDEQEVADQDADGAGSEDDDDDFVVL